MSSSMPAAQCMAQSVGTANTLVSTLLQAILAAQCAISPADLWPKDYAPHALEHGLDTYDFVVIGAGSAGSVVASRLSENPNFKVLVLEAGGDPPIESEIPSVLFAIQHTDFNWNYYTEPSGKNCLGMKNEVCYWPRGKMIGGTGSINGMLYIRGNRNDYDGWLENGNFDWGWDSVLPYFEKSVHPVGNESTPIGYVTLNEFGEFDIPVRNLILDAAKELGIESVKKFDEGSDIGYSVVSGTVQNGQRVSTGRGHLGKVSERPNLHVIKNAHVTKINVDNDDNKCVRSVDFVLQNKFSMTVNVAKEVVLSAGTINSPHILMLSGIGPRTHLENLGIPVVKDLMVGDNLQDHLIVPIFFKLQESTSSPIQQKEMLDNIYNYLIHSKGPYGSHSILSLVGFVNTEEKSTSPYPDIEYHHIFLQQQADGLDIWLKAVELKTDLADSLKEILATSNMLILYVVMLRPKSVGSIRLRSSNYTDHPKIFPNCLSVPEDIETLIRGIRFQMKMEQTKVFRENEAEIVHLPIPECDKLKFKSDDYWRCYMKYLAYTVYHLTGTVKMGPDSDKTAVVDGKLRLRGVDGLRVADASIMPNVPSANTNAATIMIAERAADFIRKDWSLECDFS